MNLCIFGSCGFHGMSQVCIIGASGVVGMRLAVQLFQVLLCFSFCVFVKTS
jgi:hypothetical protein